MTFIIDRFEGNMAVVELGDNFYNIPKALLPENAKEGDVITTEINEKETKVKKAEARSLLDDLFNERK